MINEIFIAVRIGIIRFPKKLLLNLQGPTIIE